MTTAKALRSFDHNGKVAKGDDVSERFDIITLRALKRSGLVSLVEDEGSAPVPKPKGPPVATTGSLGKAPKPKGKAGQKSAASHPVQASTPPTLPPSVPGALPPLPGESS